MLVMLFVLLTLVCRLTHAVSLEQNNIFHTRDADSELIENQFIYLSLFMFEDRKRIKHKHSYFICRFQMYTFIV